MSKHENEHDTINADLRRAFGAHRFTVDGQGRLLRGPDEEPAEAGPDVPAALRPTIGPTDAVNRAIRRQLTGQG